MYDYSNSFFKVTNTYLRPEIDSNLNIVISNVIIGHYLETAEEPLHIRPVVLESIFIDRFK